MIINEELEATKDMCERKTAEILNKGDEKFTFSDLRDLCTLAQLKDAANKLIEPTR